MGDALFWHRLQFAFTAVFHYLFPQLTLGLALVIVALKSLHVRTRDGAYARAASFWVRIFGINFAVGVVTGFPLEFQFGTNLARFTHDAGGVIGQTLAMEGMFAFFLESTFLGLLVWGEKRFSEKAHLGIAVALLVGSWSSGYFIVTTNAFLQHPVGWRTLGDVGDQDLPCVVVLNPRCQLPVPEPAPRTGGAQRPTVIAAGFAALSEVRHRGFMVVGFLRADERGRCRRGDEKKYYE